MGSKEDKEYCVKIESINIFLNRKDAREYAIKILQAGCTLIKIYERYREGKSQ